MRKGFSRRDVENVTFCILSLHAYFSLSLHSVSYFSSFPFSPFSFSSLFSLFFLFFLLFLLLPPSLLFRRNGTKIEPSNLIRFEPFLFCPRYSICLFLRPFVVTFLRLFSIASLIKFLDKHRNSLPRRFFDFSNRFAPRSNQTMELAFEIIIRFGKQFGRIYIIFGFVMSKSGSFFKISWRIFVINVDCI